MGADASTRYPLTGIRAATTEPQLAVLAAAHEVLAADERILAAWVAGSFAAGWEDPFSDVEVHGCVEDDVADELAGEGWKELLARIAPTVLAVSFPPPGVGGYALTPEWVHLDLAFERRSQFDADVLETFEPLFDRTGTLLPAEGRRAEVTEGEPYFPHETVDWFFHMLGNLVTVVGRNEPVLGSLGTMTLRDTCLVPLLYAERGTRRSGGVKRLRPFLSDEQHDLLEDLPPFTPTIDGVIDGSLAIARIFVPRARALAERTGAAWPLELEAATIAHIERGLGIVLAIPG